MSPVAPALPLSKPSSAPLWTWINAGCGLFEFGTIEDFRAGLASGRLEENTPIWRNAPGCHSIPARFLSVPWTVHRPGGVPAEKVDFAMLQRRFLSGQLPAGSKLGQDGAILPEQIFGPPSFATVAAKP